MPCLTRRLTRNLSQRAWRHPSGLRLLHNLEGRGEANQLTPDDVQLVLETLLAAKGLVLVDVPLYPAAVLHRAAGCCARVVLVTSGDPVSMGAARAGLKMMERLGIDVEQVGLVLLAERGSEAGAELGCPVVAHVPPGDGLGDLASGGVGRVASSFDVIMAILGAEGGTWRRLRVGRPGTARAGPGPARRRTD